MLENEIEQCLLSILAVKNMLKSSYPADNPIMLELEKAAQSAKRVSSVVSAVKTLVKA
jgi:hypothetical protein